MANTSDATGTRLMEAFFLLAIDHENYRPYYGNGNIAAANNYLDTLVFHRLLKQPDAAKVTAFFQQSSGRHGLPEQCALEMIVPLKGVLLKTVPRLT